MKKVRIVNINIQEIKGVYKKEGQNGISKMV